VVPRPAGDAVADVAVQLPGVDAPAPGRVGGALEPLDQEVRERRPPPLLPGPRALLNVAGAADDAARARRSALVELRECAGAAAGLAGPRRRTSASGRAPGRPGRAGPRGRRRCTGRPGSLRSRRRRAPGGPASPARSTGWPRRAGR